MKLNHTLKAIMLMLLMSCLVAEDLEFVASEANIEVAPSERMVHVDFPFVVTAKKAVRIVNVERSCTCVTYSAERALFNPGEKDFLRIWVDAGDIAGSVSRNLLVKSWSETPTKEESHPLTIRINAASPFLPVNRVVSWRIGSSMLAQERNFQVQPQYELVELFIEDPAKDPRLRIEQNTAENKRTMLVRLTPTTTERAQWLLKGCSTAVISYKIRYRMKGDGFQPKTEYVNAMITVDTSE